MRSLLNVVSFVVLVVIAAPSAFACENPDDIRVWLRATPPPAVDPDEVVLQVDPKSFKEVNHPYAQFDVERVVTGDFPDGVVLLQLYPWSTCFRIASKPSDNILVGTLSKVSDGPTVLRPRTVALEWRDRGVEPKATGN